MPRKGGGSSGGRTYVNNAANVRLGRVGMAMGSAPVSRTSSSYNSGSSGRTYVDNSQNRNLGRVGMAIGSAPVSSASSSYNSGSSGRTYVDNSQNRNLGRVGMAMGSAPVSSASSLYISGSSGRTYVDNSQNRNLGRVGMAMGSAPVSRTSKNSVSISTRRYVDNSFNRKLERVGLPIGSAVVSEGSRNSHPITKDSRNDSKHQMYYVDNSFNRKVGRVGLPRGSKSIPKTPTKEEIRDAYRTYADDPVEGITQYTMPQEVGQYFPDESIEHYRQIQEMFERMKLWQQEKEVKRITYSMDQLQAGDLKGRSKTPFESYRGAIIAYEDLQVSANKIGHGGFGDIFEAKWQGKVVAVKKLRVQRVSNKRLTQFEAEVSKFCRLRHKNVVTFHGACIKTPNLCIVMELMEGSLHDKIHVEEYQFSDKIKVFITKEIACGLDYLHSEDAAHCDIKSSNVLVSVFNDETVCVKLTDFGLTLMKNESSTTSSHLVAGIGTPRYSAPEILRGEILDLNKMKMTDVYSFGLVVFEVYSEKEPFSDLSIHQLRRHVGKGVLTPPVEDFENEIMKDLVKKCWLREPINRPTMEHVVKTLSNI